MKSWIFALRKALIMNQGKYIFSQLTDFLPRRVFDRIVDKYEGNKYVRSFSCWNQMLFMVFGQLTAKDSMRDLMLSIEAHHQKYYHLGFGSTVSCRNLGTANEGRNYKIYEEFAYVLIEEARRSCYHDDFEIEVDGMFMHWTLQLSTYVWASSGGQSSESIKEE